MKDAKMTKTGRFRKSPDGPLRNKERTKRKILAAVGKIFSKEGHKSLNIKKISEVAGIDRKMIYTYFGSLEGLLNTYFIQKDFWTPFHNEFISKLLEGNKSIMGKDIFTILKAQFDAVMDNKQFEKAIHWEISEKSQIMRKVSDEREQVGQKLFMLMQDCFKNTTVDVPGTLALQIGGIYYIALHSKINGSTFCGIDVNTTQGRLRIERVLKQNISDLFKKGKHLT